MSTAFVRRLVLCLALFSGALSCWAIGEESAYTTDIQPHIIGVDVGIGYRGAPLLPDVDTTIWVYLGGTYKWLSYYRDATGALIAPGALGSADPGYTRIEGDWRLGIEQGFAWNARTKGNLTGAFAYYTGRVDSNQFASGSLLAGSSLPDRNGIFLNTILAGFTYDDMLFDQRHKMRDGVSAEASLEWGPSFLFNTLAGNSNFVRLNANFTWFKPLYDMAPEKPASFFNLYLGEFISVDYAAGFGTPVPLPIRQTFGGRTRLVEGLGGQVRGVDADSLDTNLKAVNNLELRANGPALFNPNIVPGLLVFWDAGYYNQVGEAGIASPGSGFVTTIGAGGFLDFLDLGTGAGYFCYRLDNVNAGGQRLSFMIEFGLHF